jgi:hypothetical protein
VFNLAPQVTNLLAEAVNPSVRAINPVTDHLCCWPISMADMISFNACARPISWRK